MCFFVLFIEEFKANYRLIKGQICWKMWIHHLDPPTTKSLKDNIAWIMIQFITALQVKFTQYFLENRPKMVIKFKG